MLVSSLFRTRLQRLESHSHFLNLYPKGMCCCPRVLSFQSSTSSACFSSPTTFHFPRPVLTPQKAFRIQAISGKARPSAMRPLLSDIACPQTHQPSRSLLDTAIHGCGCSSDQLAYMVSSLTGCGYATCALASYPHLTFLIICFPIADTLPSRNIQYRGMTAGLSSRGNFAI